MRDDDNRPPLDLEAPRLAFYALHCWRRGLSCQSGLGQGLHGIWQLPFRAFFFGSSLNDSPRKDPSAGKPTSCRSIGVLCGAIAVPNLGKEPCSTKTRGDRQLGQAWKLFIRSFPFLDNSNVAWHPWQVVEPSKTNNIPHSGTPPSDRQISASTFDSIPRTQTPLYEPARLGRICSTTMAQRNPLCRGFRSLCATGFVPYRPRQTTSRGASS